MIEVKYDDRPAVLRMEEEANIQARILVPISHPRYDEIHTKVFLAMLDNALNRGDIAHTSYAIVKRRFNNRR